MKAYELHAAKDGLSLTLNDKRAQPEPGQQVLLAADMARRDGASAAGPDVAERHERGMESAVGHPEIWQHLVHRVEGDVTRHTGAYQALPSFLRSVSPSE